jgi:hypothetical protein
MIIPEWTELLIVKMVERGATSERILLSSQQYYGT